MRKRLLRAPCQPVRVPVLACCALVLAVAPRRPRRGTPPRRGGLRRAPLRGRRGARGRTPRRRAGAPHDGDPRRVFTPLRGLTAAALIRRLRADTGVRYAEPDFLVSAS